MVDPCQINVGPASLTADKQALGRCAVFAGQIHETSASCYFNVGPALCYNTIATGRFVLPVTLISLS